MPAPKAQLDLEDVALHEGAAVLIRRALSGLSAGDVLEVRSSSESVDADLALWCRKSGHSYLRKDEPRGVYLIERGAEPQLLARPLQVAAQADSRWGLAPRGAAIESGGPSFSFTLNEQRQVWGESLAQIYKQSVNNQWSSRDIAWDDIKRERSEVEVAVAQIMTFLTENEFAALYVPARFIPRIHPHYREVVEVLSMQIADEARHAEAFTRRAEVAGGLGVTAVSGQLSLQTLLEEADFTIAVFLLCVMGEGTFLTLLKFLEEHAPDEPTKKLMLLAHRDEARHVAFGVEHARYVLQEEPERRSSLASAVEHRSRMLAAISGLSPYVHDSLVVYAAGGIQPSQIRRGAAAVATLQREMDRQRRERLQGLGFDVKTATQMSVYHTKNFM
jgi:TusA-related sulfurtransferase